MIDPENLTNDFLKLFLKSPFCPRRKPWQPDELWLPEVEHFWINFIWKFLKFRICGNGEKVPNFLESFLAEGLEIF